MPSSNYTTLRDAILNKLIVSAEYKGYNRIFCPHVIGRKRGKEHVLTYQFGGSSSSGLPPDGEWRCFDVNGLSNVSTSSGPWHTGASHTQPQSCVDDIDVEVSF